MNISTSEQIKILINRKGMSISEVAEKAGWKQSNFSNKLKRNNFSEADLRKIAEALDCDLVISFEEIK